MPEAVRIAADDARRKVESGEALLVCAYESEDKCRQYKLENAITLNELQGRLPSLSKEQEMIFYCA